MIKNFLRNRLRKTGFDIIHYKDTLGRFILDDIGKYIKFGNPLIFDVGANTGQSVKGFIEKFPDATIHSFEPSAETFEILRQNVSTNKNVNIWNFGLGSANEEKRFFENNNSDMSSFLALGEFGWGKIIKETVIPIMTIDQFCLDHQITKIDLLKIDTQGYDFEVIKGAEKMISENKVGLLYFEIIFSSQYEGLPPFSQIMSFLENHNFCLVTLYPFAYQKKLASWTNGLFIHKSYMRKNFS